MIAATVDDVALMRAVANGDRPSLATLYDRHGVGMLGLAFRILGDRQCAEDLLHDVFLEVWRKAPDFDPERGSVRGWLFLRLRSRALDRLRTTARRGFEVEAREGHRQDMGSVFAADRLAIHRAVAALSVEHRVVIELGYYEGLSSSEIARRLAAPIGTVKSRVRAALAQLRSALETP